MPARNYTRLNALLRTVALLLGPLAWAAIGVLAILERRGRSPAGAPEFEMGRPLHSAATE